MRAYELRQHDVISYYPPQPHKQEYKLGEHISINELAEAMFGSPALRLDRDKNEDKIFRVIEIGICEISVVEVLEEKKIC